MLVYIKRVSPISSSVPVKISKQTMVCACFFYNAAYVLAIVGLIALWFNKKFSYWKNRGFVFVKPDFPFGLLKGVGFKVHLSQVTKRFYSDYNKAKAIGVYFFTAPAVFVTDLDTIKNVLVKDFSSFHDRGLYVNKTADPLSAHLFAIEGESRLTFYQFKVNYLM